MVCFTSWTHRLRVSRGHTVHLIHHLFFLRVIVTEQLFNRMSDNHISYPRRCNKGSLNRMPGAAHTHYSVSVSQHLRVA